MGILIILVLGAAGGFLAHMAVSGSLKDDIAVLKNDVANLKAKLP